MGASRIYKIKCVGDQEQVADMLEDIAKNIRKGQIHGGEDMFYEIWSHGYVKEENRGDWYKKEIKKIK